MASTESRVMKGGATRFRVTWMQDGRRQSETFGSKLRAEAFQGNVEAAGNRWPEGWMKGRGFIRSGSPEAVETVAQPSFEEVALADAAQRADITPGTRKRYSAYARTLARVQLSDGRRPFERPIDQITEDDIKDWLRLWPRSLKTKSNYHGFLSGVFTYAVRKGYRQDNPALGTGPTRRKIREQQREPVYLKKPDFARLVGALPDDISKDMVRVLAGTGLRWSELTALWVEDFDPGERQLHVRKAWKAAGDDGAIEMPGWIRARLQDKHQLRGHYLGSPKTEKSKRTLYLSPRVNSILESWCRGKELDDFIFQTASGLPWHGNEFQQRRWAPARREVGMKGLHVHDLRHSFVAWMLAGGERLDVVSKMLGHESYAFTVDVYHRLLAPERNPAAEAAIDSALGGPVRVVSVGVPADAEAPAHRAG